MEDERHRREEQERRAKRKATKGSLSSAQKEKERKRSEYRQEVLRKHGQGGGSSKRQKKEKGKGAQTKTQAPSAFQNLFEQRAQGFHIDFRFRNAPPRPPVGPCFVGESLETVTLEQCRQYKPLNAVEAQHVWKLHTEPDLGVPLAPSAMDLSCYVKPPEQPSIKLHPDDQTLLDWTGSLGDTAADQRHQRQEQARATARQMLQGPQKADKNKKKFSRVLKEDMQTWMKKTTYLSNDYSRKVHDFKSLAQTKQELAEDLQAKQDDMAQRRTRRAIEQSFDAHQNIQHPTRKNLKVKRMLPVVPNGDHWGRAFTHVVIDKAPINMPEQVSIKDLSKGAFLANVEKRGENNRMSCQLMGQQPEQKILPIQTLDLDVIPLKEEDAPHVNFCFWVQDGEATYLPISSRIQLSTGRPVIKPSMVEVERRDLTLTEQRELEERTAEVDQELAEKHHITASAPAAAPASAPAAPAVTAAATDSKKDDDGDDDGEGDFGDDDSGSDDEQVFGGGTKTIVADA